MSPSPPNPTFPKNHPQPENQSRTTQPAESDSPKSVAENANALPEWVRLTTRINDTISHSVQAGLLLEGAKISFSVFKDAVAKSGMGSEEDLQIFRRGIEAMERAFRMDDETFMMQIAIREDLLMGMEELGRFRERVVGIQEDAAGSVGGMGRG